MIKGSLLETGVHCTFVLYLSAVYSKNFCYRLKCMYLSNYKLEAYYIK